MGIDTLYLAKKPSWIQVIKLKLEILKKNLDNKTRKELIAIVKNKGIKGYSSKNKEELKKLIINHKKQNSFLNKIDAFWRAFVDGYVRVTVVILAGLLTIFGPRYCSNENTLEDSLHNLEKKPVSFAISDSFNILVLPFHPDKDCTIENTDYEGQLIERFDSLKGARNLRLNIELNKNYNCPRTIEEVKKIGLTENADFVIWGYYDEDCEDEVKVRLKYYLVDSIDVDFNRFGDTHYQAISDFQKLREGVLQREIDYIINFTLAFYKESEEDFAKAVEILNSINTNECDTLILGNLANLYSKMGNYRRADSISQKMLLCPHNDYALFLSGIINSRAKRFENALDYYNLGIVRDTMNFALRRNKIFCLIHLKRYEEAMKEINRLLSLKTYDVDIIRMRGDVFMATKKNELAKKEFEYIITHYPSDYFALTKLATIYHLEGNAKKRSFYTNVLFENHNDKADAYVKKIGDKLLSEEFDSVYIYIESGLNKFPDDTLLLEFKKELYE